MKLSDIVNRELILLSLQSDAKEDVIEELLGSVVAQHPELDLQAILKQVLAREQLSSTGIGSGIAIPHARVAQVKDHVLIIGRSLGGIEFEAIDDKDVTLFFMLLSPVDMNESHLRLLARISKFLHDTSFREQLFRAETAGEVVSAMEKKDSEY